MDPLTMGLLSGSMGFGQSMLGGRSQRKQRRRMKKKLNRALDSTEAIQGRALQQQGALTRQATAQQLAGYDSAKREASRMGRASKQSALDREQQLGASLTQNLQNRGLGSLTVGGNLQRGLAADTQRQLGGINESLASMLGELALGRSGAEAAGTQALSGLAGQQGDLMSQLAQMRALDGAQLGGFEIDQSMPQGGLQSLLGGAQTGLGVMAGMGQQQSLEQMIQKLFGGPMGQYMQNPSAQYELADGFTGPRRY